MKKFYFLIAGIMLMCNSVLGGIRFTQKKSVVYRGKYGNLTNISANIFGLTFIGPSFFDPATPPRNLKRKTSSPEHEANFSVDGKFIFCKGKMCFFVDNNDKSNQLFEVNPDTRLYHTNSVKRSLLISCALSLSLFMYYLWNKRYTNNVDEESSDKLDLDGIHNIVTIT